MAIKKTSTKASSEKLDANQRAYLEDQMTRLSERNPSWKIASNNYKALFPYFVAQKLFFLYDDEVFELLVPVDHSITGKQEELLDYYLILDTGDEVQLKLFQFKFSEKYAGGISTKELYAFVDRMNRVFLKGDLQDDKTLEAFKEVRLAFDKAQKANPKAKTRVHCYYVVNGQNVSASDADKVEAIRITYQGDRQSYGFIFEPYGGLDIYNLAAHGRVPIHREILEMEHPDTGTVLHWNIGKNPNGMPIQVVQGFVNVNQLIRLVDRYSNNELFERNVRLFLGSKKEVNKRIIETITSDKSGWFGFMNNGVSITADEVAVNPPPTGKRLKVVLDNMQIINGCQTVNALYHAKYEPALKDKFQGNSNVLVRIYHIDRANEDFMRELIVATNSQNAIRAEDLVANDPPQIELETIFRTFGVAYERKEGAKSNGRSWFSFTKESAALAFMAVFWAGFASKLRNSASRREIFLKGIEYNEIYSWEDDASGRYDANCRYPASSADFRAIHFLTAIAVERSVRNSIGELAEDRKSRGGLRKAAYFLSRAIFLKNKDAIEKAMKALEASGLKQQNAEKLKAKVEAIVGVDLAGVISIFEKTMKHYVEAHGGDEDAALKNTAFADLFEQAILAPNRL
jgi:hypothetical protein